MAMDRAEAGSGLARDLAIEVRDNNRPVGWELHSDSVSSRRLVRGLHWLGLGDRRSGSKPTSSRTCPLRITFFFDLRKARGFCRRAMGRPRGRSCMENVFRTGDKLLSALLADGSMAPEASERVFRAG